MKAAVLHQVPSVYSPLQHSCLVLLSLWFSLHSPTLGPSAKLQRSWCGAGPEQCSLSSFSAVNLHPHGHLFLLTSSLPSLCSSSTSLSRSLSFSVQTLTSPLLGSTKLPLISDFISDFLLFTALFPLHINIQPLYLDLGLREGVKTQINIWRHGNTTNNHPVWKSAFQHGGLIF